MAFVHTHHKRTVGQHNFGIARQRTGSVTADAGPYTFATYPTLIDDQNTGVLPGPESTDPVTGAFLGGSKHETLLVGVSFGGGGSLKLQPRIPNGDLSLWVPFIDNTGAIVQSPALTSLTTETGGVWECWVFGDRPFFFVKDVTGTVTDLEIVVRPGRPRVGGFYP